MAEREPESNNQHQQTQVRLLMSAAAAGIILISVALTLWLSGVFRPDSESNPGYQNITFTDATIACENKARAAHGATLQQLVMDGHSSRFDSRRERYKIFFTATMGSLKAENGVAEFYINCFVSTYRGRITSFEIYEKKEDSTDAIRKDKGGIFGWPMN